MRRSRINSRRNEIHGRIRRMAVSIPRDARPRRGSRCCQVTGRRSDVQAHITTARSRRWSNARHYTSARQGGEQRHETVSSTRCSGTRASSRRSWLQVTHPGIGARIWPDHNARSSHWPPSFRCILCIHAKSLATLWAASRTRTALLRPVPAQGIDSRASHKPKLSNAYRSEDN
jgi:hypothetical protein